MKEGVEVPIYQKLVSPIKELEVIRKLSGHSDFS